MIVFITRELKGGYHHFNGYDPIQSRHSLVALAACPKFLDFITNEEERKEGNCT